MEHILYIRPVLNAREKVWSSDKEFQVLMGKDLR